MHTLNILLMGSPSGSSNPYQGLIMMGIIVVVFYFFMIRPQMKKQKEMNKFREGLKNGDKVITTGGIYGKIVEVRDAVLIIEVEDKMRLKVDKASVVADPSDLEKK